MCPFQNENDLSAAKVCSILQILAGTPLVDHEVTPITVLSWQKAETGGRTFTENELHLKLKLFLEPKQVASRMYPS